MRPEFLPYNEDCIAGMPARIAPARIGGIVTSIPFGALFVYSGKNEDIGNNPDGTDMRAGQFGLHMRFCIQQMYDALMPGRVACIHIQQLRTTKVQHGVMGRRDFRGAVVDLFTAGGFEWTGEFVIPKDPQAIAQREKLHSLQFTTGIERDACVLAPACNDYVMIFRKPGTNPEPVRCLYDSKRNPNGWVSTEEWIRWAHGVWTDIHEIDVLDGWQSGREQGDEKHVCPLQLSVIQRCVRLYTNPYDWVCDPFGGIGSTGFVCLGGKANDGVLHDPRNVVLFELKESYFAQLVRNCQRVLTERGNDYVPVQRAFALGGGGGR